MSENPLEKSNAMKVLLSLSSGGKTYTELLLTAGITPTTLNRRLADLQSVGLIQKAEKKGSKRGEKIYTLTQKGMKLIPSLQNLLKILKE